MTHQRLLLRLTVLGIVSITYACTVQHNYGSPFANLVIRTPTP